MSECILVIVVERRGDPAGNFVDHH